VRSAAAEVGALLRRGEVFDGSERFDLALDICGMVFRSNDLPTNVLLR
jgi:hypothetical protein